MSVLAPCPATARAREAGFPMSCDPAVGRLLAVLAAQLPGQARVLELGTGVGVGTAWIVSGLLPRTDVMVLTVEEERQYGLERGAFAFATKPTSIRQLPAR